MSTTLYLDPATIAAYRETARRRWDARQEQLALRREHAWQVARQAAGFLRDEFGAIQVAVFGSLARGDWFSSTSDIDLAVWGLPPEDYFLAVARLQDLSTEFKIDLVAIERSRQGLRDTIEREAKTL